MRIRQLVKSSRHYDVYDPHVELGHGFMHDKLRLRMF